MRFFPRAYRLPDDLNGRLLARHVPQLFSAEEFDRELAGLFDFDDFLAGWDGASARYRSCGCSRR